MSAPEVSRATARQHDYADGVISAAAALMSDLEHAGALDGAKVIGAQDGAPAICTSCEMRKMGFTGLADRLDFAVDVAMEGGQP